MERLIQIAFYHFAVSPDGLPHSRSRWAWPCEQSLDKLPRLGGIELNLAALGNNPAGNFANMRNCKCSHRVTLNRSRFFNKLLVRCRHTGDKPFTSLRFCYCWHGVNVC